MIRHLVTAGLLALPAAAAAQTAPWSPPPADSTLPDPSTPAPAGRPGAPDPGDLIARGVESVLQDFLGRAQPHLEGLANDLQGLARDYGPALNELSGLIDDIGNYEPPQRLPNGDVLIRRKADAPPAPPLDELQRLVPDAPAAVDPPIPQTSL